MREKDALLSPCSKWTSTSTRVEYAMVAKNSAVRINAKLLIVLGFLLLMLLPCQLLAQSVGNLFGDVEDAQGYAVPGATVVVLSQDRGFSRTVTSNDTGLFSIPSLPNGTYTVTVTMQGFQKFERKDIVLDADANVKLTCKLTVAGAPTTVVEVQDTAAGVSDVNLQTATIGTLIAPNIVEDIPLQDRSIVGVAATLPGVVDVNAPATFTGDKDGPTYSTAGARMAANLFLFDGVMYNNLYRNTGLNYPPPDAIQEVSILLNNYGAEYGRNTGSVFNAITKSGTNDLHGSLWEYHRNTALNAVNWYSKYISYGNYGATGLWQEPAKNKFIQNQFGGTFSGHIIKDKLFYFTSYQGLRLAATSTSSTAITPTAAELGNIDANGMATTNASFADYWGMMVKADHPQTWYRDNYGNISTSSSDSRFNGPAIAFQVGNPNGTLYCDAVQAYPGAPKQNCVDHFFKIPTSSTTNSANAAGEAAVLGQYQGCVGALAEMEAKTGQHNLNPGSGTNGDPGYLIGAMIPQQCLSPVIGKIANKYFRINGQFNPVANAQVVTTGNTPKTDDNGFFRLDYNMGKHTLSGRFNLINADDAVVSTKTTSVTSYGIMKDWARSKFIGVDDQWIISQSVLNTIRVAYRNFTGFTYPIDGTTAQDLGIDFPVFSTPTVPVITAGSVLALADKSYTWSNSINKSFEITDAISWTKGNHTFQFGGSFLRLQYQNFSDGETQGYFHFSTTGTGQTAMGDMVMGSLSGSSAVDFATGRSLQSGVNNNYFFYAKDDWRILKRLSLSLGLRYELPMPWYEPDNYWGTFSPGVQSTVIPNAPLGMLFPGDAGVPRGIIQTPKKQFMPRIGFSYDVFGTGKTALRGGFGIFYNATNANIVQNGNQPWQCTYMVNTIANISTPLSATPGWGYCDPKNPTFSGMQTVFYPQSDFKPSYAMAYNLGIQQRLPGRVTMEINYVGKAGRHEFIVYQANPALYVPGASSTNNTDQRRLYYGYGDNLSITSAGSSNYNSLQVLATRRMSKSLTLSSSYTWGRSIDLNSGEFRGVLSESGRIPYVWDLSSERGPSDYNATHVFNATWTYDISKMAKYKGNSMLSQILNGWSIGQTMSFRSGQPVNITAGSDISFSGTNDQRPVFMGADWRLPSGRSESEFVEQWFNTSSGAQPGEGATSLPSGCTSWTPYVGVDGRTYQAAVCSPSDAWEKPAPGAYGNVGRNTVVGPPQLKDNMFLKKSFRVKEGMSLQFRCDAYGVFNSPIFGKPTGGFGSNFGRITKTTGERQLQLSLKLKF